MGKWCSGDEVGKKDSEVGKKDSEGSLPLHEQNGAIQEPKAKYLQSYDLMSALMEDCPMTEWALGQHFRLGRHPQGQKKVLPSSWEQDVWQSLYLPK